MGEMEKRDRTFARTVRSHPEMGRTRPRTRARETRLVIDAATLVPIKELVARVAAFRDVDAACALLFMQSRTPSEVARELSRTCARGGEADRLADRLADPREARRYARRLADTFAPFAEILRGLNVTADGNQWVRIGVRYVQMKADAARRKRDEIRQRTERQRARTIATYEEAAAAIGIPIATAHNYAYEGKLVAVYLDGKKKAAGVTRASLDAYVKRQEMRKAAAAANAARKEAERAEREANADTYWTADGRKIDGADRITARQIADEFSVSKRAIWNASRRGMIAKVYNTESRKHAVGYLRESVETWARAYKANVAAGGTRRRA